MEHFVSLCCLTVVLAMVAPAYGQITTPCNISMVTSSISPCMSFLTNSSGNGTSPTADCCNSIKSLTSGSKDCLCLVVTGNVPFTLPINRTLAISLPRACNLPGVPLQCKTSGSPLPAPGPASLGPSLSPASTPSAPSLSPQASSILPTPVTPSLPPQPETATPSVNADSPSPTSERGRSDLTPSSAGSPTYSLLPSVVIILFGFAVFKHY
ncbi:non-specific lipid transfer protein GPI-anchored 20 [Cicer arietinum]|uniref:Non-specific lipid-transfer protein-like protein At5g64080 n=1 Tax=Cicer arietinum TaxID=3827 RepID=A0A1S2YX86_CICAR|nr:non-specific lipid-transfer protein-like protein At5g64080 [Cicer arietinum]